MELKTISKIYFARLSNAYHVSFLSNVKAGLEKYDAVQLGIPVNLYSAFLAALEIEQDIVNRSRASVFTQKLAEFDKTRDNYFKRIYYKLRTAECRHTAERCYLQITYQLAATANAESEDIDEMMKIEMCRNVIDELNLLVKDFKAKAYKKTNLDDEELEDENDNDNENV